MSDPKEIEEVMGGGEETSQEAEFEADQKKSTESPASVTIKGYYKGYSVLITNRDPEVAVAPLLAKAINGINWMVENGFLPSWNTDTNAKVNGKTVQSAPAKVETDLPICPVHNKLMKERTGADGQTFFSHAEKTDDGRWIYCSGRGFGGK